MLAARAAPPLFVAAPRRASPPPARPRQIDAARGKALADEFRMRFFETSAKDGTNVKEAFHVLARDVISKMLAGDASAAAGAADAGAGGGKGKGDKEKCAVA
jgi:hypothetical protein